MRAASSTSPFNIVAVGASNSIPQGYNPLALPVFTYIYRMENTSTTPQMDRRPDLPESMEDGSNQQSPNLGDYITFTLKWHGIGAQLEATAAEDAVFAGGIAAALS